MKIHLQMHMSVAPWFCVPKGYYLFKSESKSSIVFVDASNIALYFGQHFPCDLGAGSDL